MVADPGRETDETFDHLDSSLDRVIPNLMVDHYFHHYNRHCKEVSAVLIYHLICVDRLRLRSGQTAIS